jgi:hypothetical protein
MFAIRFAGAACALALSVAALSASADVDVGGNAMFPQKNIVGHREAPFISTRPSGWHRFLHVQQL